MSDITKRGEILGMDSTMFVGGFYNTLTASSDTRNVMPGGNATLGRLSSNLLSDTTNYGLRAREELRLTSALKDRVPCLQAAGMWAADGRGSG